MNNKSSAVPFYLVTVIVLTAVGFWLRYRCLGCLGFAGDEDLTSLAVKALSSKGVPELPSGMIYLRFYPYQWLLSLSVDWFGFSEFSMRLPAVLLGTALIPVAFVIIRKIADDKIALLVALGIAVCFWQVEMSRLARMYAPFFLFYLLAAAEIYRCHFSNTNKLFSPFAILLSMAALSMHQLAYSLAVFYLLAIPLNASLRRTMALVTQSGIIAASFLLLKRFQEGYFYRAKDLFGAPEAVTVTGQDSGGIVAAILSQLSIPDPTLLRQSIEVWPVATILLAAIVAALVFVCFRSSAHLRVWPRAFGFAALVLAALHQFNLAFVLLGLLIATNQNGLKTVRDKAFIAFLSATIALFIVWVAIAFMISGQSPGEIEIAAIGLRKLLRLLVDYPNFRLFWSFVLERPLLALPLGLGTIWCLGRIAQPKPDAFAIFLAGGFWGVLIANGVLETKFEFFRYNLHLDVFYIALVSLGIVKIPEILAGLGWSETSRTGSGLARWPWFAIAGALVFIGLRPDLAFHLSQRDYVETGRYFVAAGLHYHPDFRSPSEFVRERLDDNDRIFVFDPREYWNYIGRVDFWVYSERYQSQSYFDGARYRDLYLGIPVLPTLAEFEDELYSTQEGDAWIVYSKSRLDWTPWISDEIKNFVLNLDYHVVFTGHDESTVVIRLSTTDRADLRAE
jgi:hypothetical protein